MASLPGYPAVPILQQVLRGRGYDLTALGYETTDDAIDDLEGTWDAVKLGMHEAPFQVSCTHLTTGVLLHALRSGKGEGRKLAIRSNATVSCHYTPSGGLMDKAPE